MNFVHIQYYGFFCHPTVKYFRSAIVVSDGKEYARRSTPYDDIPAFIEDTIIRFLMGIYIDAGSSQNALYQQMLTDFFAERVRSEKPKSVSIVAFSQGCINAALVINYMISHKDKYEDVLKKINTVFLLNGPLFLYDKINIDQDYFTIYQMYNASDKISNYPLDKSSIGLKVKNVVMIPLNMLNIVRFPHISTLLCPEAYEYIANIIVRHNSYLEDDLMSRPTRDIKVFDNQWSYIPSQLITGATVSKILRKADKYIDRIVAYDSDEKVCEKKKKIVKHNYKR